jgi:hypothetical protein
METIVGMAISVAGAAIGSLIFILAGDEYQGLVLIAGIGLIVIACFLHLIGAL